MNIKETITVPLPSATSMKPLKDTITLEEMLEVSKPIIEQALMPIDDALEKANLYKEDIDLIILAGGSSQLPGVYEMIQEKMNKKPVIIPRNLMLAISYGAALYQREIANLPKLKAKTKILGHSLGIKVEDAGRADVKILFTENQTLPCEGEYYFEIDNGNPIVTINLMTKQQDDWRKLNERTIQLKDGVESIKVKVKIDNNRLIHLEAIDVKNREVVSIDVENNHLNNKAINRKMNELGIKRIENNSNVLQPFIGIDLGTTTSELTYVNRLDGALNYLENKDKINEMYANYCFPSIVYFPSDKMEDAEIANQLAYNAVKTGTGNVYSNFKVANRNLPIGQVGENKITVQDLSSKLLAKIWNNAKDDLGDFNLKSAVITVPAAFDFDAQQETYNAAKIAGIEEVTMIDEPTAAFIYYKHMKKIDTTQIENVMIFDFGGGTTDVAILNVKNEKIGGSEGVKDEYYKVVSVSGDSNCGGKFVDDALFYLVKNRYEKANNTTMSAMGEKNLRKKLKKLKWIFQ